MADPVQFPPLAAKKQIAEQMREHYEDLAEALDQATPQQLHWVTKIQEELSQLYEADKIEFVTQMAKLAVPFLRACHEFGREVFPEIWNERDGPDFLARLALDITVKTQCVSCLLGNHKPELHIVDDK